MNLPVKKADTAGKNTRGGSSRHSIIYIPFGHTYSQYEPVFSNCSCQQGLFKQSRRYCLEHIRICRPQHWISAYTGITRPHVNWTSIRLPEELTGFRGHDLRNHPREDSSITKIQVSIVHQFGNQFVNIGSWFEKKPLIAKSKNTAMRVALRLKSEQLSRFVGTFAFSSFFHQWPTALPRKCIQFPIGVTPTTWN